MERFFLSEIYIGDTIERCFQCTQNSEPLDITGEVWTMVIKDNPNLPDASALIQDTAVPYMEGFSEGKARFEASSDTLSPMTYWFFVRREAAGVRDTIIAEQVRMVNR